MYKTDLVKTVAQKTGINQRNCKDVVDEVFRTISLAIANDERVTIRQFGHFKPIVKEGRTPGTNSKYRTKIISFRTATPLKKVYNGKE